MGQLAHRVVFACALFCGTLALVACDCNREGGPPVDYTEGTTNGDTYQTTPIDGRWLHFPGGRRYRLHHALGQKPAELSSTLSFDEDVHPEEGDESPRGSTEASGHAVIWREVTERYIEVENDTCAGFYLRVVARAAPASP
jgi:hypothetical protein